MRAKTGTQLGLTGGDRSSRAAPSVKECACFSVGIEFERDDRRVLSGRDAGVGDTDVW